MYPASHIQAKSSAPPALCLQRLYRLIIQPGEYCHISTVCIVLSILYVVSGLLYTVHCTLYTVHCTLYTVHCKLYTVYCTLYTVHCTLYTVHCIPLYNVHSPVQCTVQSSIWSLYSVIILRAGWEKSGVINIHLLEVGREDCTGSMVILEQTERELVWR